MSTLPNNTSLLQNQTDIIKNYVYGSQLLIEINHALPIVLGHLSLSKNITLDGNSNITLTTVRDNNSELNILFKKLDNVINEDVNNIFTKQLELNPEQLPLAYQYFQSAVKHIYNNINDVQKIQCYLKTQAYYIVGREYKNSFDNLADHYKEDVDKCSLAFYESNVDQTIRDSDDSFISGVINFDMLNSTLV